jgi:hypothetical protein
LRIVGLGRVVLYRFAMKGMGRLVTAERLPTKQKSREVVTKSPKIFTPKRKLLTKVREM